MVAQDEKFVKQCKDAYEYMASLIQSNEKGESLEPNQLIDQLGTVVEELAVAGEELSQQAEELAASRQQIAAERQHYQDLFDFAPDGYLVTTKDSKILDCNVAATTLFHMTHKHIIGKPLSDFVAKPDQKLFSTMLDKLCGDKQHTVFEWRMIMQPREELQFHALITARSSHDSTKAEAQLRWMVHDISKQIKLEEDRQLLLERLVNTHEEIRSITARELHDQMAQHLTAIIIELQSMKKSAQSDDTVKTIDKLLSITGEIGHEVHQIASELRPASIDDLGIEKALANYVNEWSKQTGIAASFLQSGKTEPRMVAEIEIATYRVVQQALNNIFNHAKANHVSVVLDRRNEQFDVIIEDNGQGFDVEAILRHGATKRALGLIGMKERAALVGGTFEIESHTGQGGGTTVFIRIPLRVAAPHSSER